MIDKDSTEKKMSNLTMPKLPSKVKFWKKRSSADITDFDPTFRVIYLGNVLTGWAKGDGCVDKPLATLWKNHKTSEKPDIIMKVTVCASGLKAVTKEHGLTEYWAHRITFCNSEPAYPKVFCWIYRHEGRKMKQELRCHAVLCPSENKASLMSKRLKERLHQALIDFKKEKVCRQNARLSLANAADDQKTMPFRKIMLQPGSSNYRPPLEKGKSAPKLKVIEEVIFEEDEDDLDILEPNLDAEEVNGIAHELFDKPQRQKLTSMLSSGIRDSNLLISNSHWQMTSSDSLPLLASTASVSSNSEMSSRCTSSLSMDALSTMTAVTSFIDDDQEYDGSRDSNPQLHLTIPISSSPDLTMPRKSNFQNLVLISSDPSPEVSRKVRQRPQILCNDVASSTLEADSEDEDKVTDYLEKLSVELASECCEGHFDSETPRSNATVSNSEISPSRTQSMDSDIPASPLMNPRLAINEQDNISDEFLEKLSVEVTSECCEGHFDSQTPRSKAATSNSEVSPRTQSTDSDNQVSPLIASRLAANEQDIISDESGYSEESSNPSNKIDLEEDIDNTVTGVLISDFSPAERLKYLQRSKSVSLTRGLKPPNGQESKAQPEKSVHKTKTSEFFQDKMPEFCINI